MRPLRESLAGDSVSRVLGHRQRHHQLHPHPDGRDGRELRRRARRGAGARLRRGRPDRRRRGLRRRGQGRDPRRRSRSTPGSPLADVYREGITARHRRRHRDAPRRWVTSSSCSRSRAAADGAGRVRARAPGDGARAPTRWPACARRSTRCSSRREAVGPADVLRPRRRRRARPRSAVLGDLVAVGRNRLSGARGAGESALRRPRRSGRSARPSTRYYVALDVADQPGVLAAVARRSPTTTSRSRRCGRRAAATTRRCVVVTHTASEAALPRDRRGAARPRRRPRGRLGDAGRGR